MRSVRKRVAGDVQGVLSHRLVGAIGASRILVWTVFSAIYVDTMRRSL